MKLHRLVNGQMFLSMTSDHINWSECCELLLLYCTASSWLDAFRSALQEGSDIEYEGMTSHRAHDI